MGEYSMFRKVFVSLGAIGDGVRKHLWFVCYHLDHCRSVLQQPHIAGSLGMLCPSLLRAGLWLLCGHPLLITIAQILHLPCPNAISLWAHQFSPHFRIPALGYMEISGFTHIRSAVSSTFICLTMFSFHFPLLWLFSIGNGHAMLLPSEMASGTQVPLAFPLIVNLSGNFSYPTITPGPTPRLQRHQIPSHILKAAYLRYNPSESPCFFPTIRTFIYSHHHSQHL